MNFQNNKFILLLFIGVASLFLGYQTHQVLFPQPSHQEIIIEMPALPAPSESPKANATGQSIYEAHCAACHDTGAANAPKIKDKSAWASRLSKETSVLLEHVINGYNLMPPKGACLECSNTDLKKAVTYMIKQSKD